MKRQISLRAFFETKKVKSSDQIDSSKIPTEDTNKELAQENFKKLNALPANSSLAEDDTTCIVQDGLYRSSYYLNDNIVGEDKNVTCKRYDIGNFIRSTVDDEEKYNVLLQTWKPGKNYEFPNTGKSHTRRFQLKWLEDYPWLSYSQKEEGGFCKICVLFSKDEAGGQNIQTLKTKAMTRYKNAISDLKDHANREYHKDAILSAMEFEKIMQGKQDNISVQLNLHEQQIIEENRQKLIPIIQTIIFCGRQNIALRGHRDDIVANELIEHADENCGNFKELLKFRVDAGDDILRKHLSSAPKNSTFISKTIQNEFIAVMGSMVIEKLVKKIKSNFFSLLCDETADINQEEQLSIAIRHLDTENCIVREDFLAFQSVTNLTGNFIAATIIKKLKELGLDIEYLRGQGYDGGSNMAGIFNGVRAHILKIQPKALYIHCASHRLNLVLLKACSIQSIRDLFSTVSETIRFVRDSPKRSQLLKEKIHEHLPTTKSEKLLKLCETRWVEKHTSMLRFNEMLFAIISFLEEMSLKSEGQILSRCNGLLKSILNFNFIISLQICTNVFSLTLPISRSLQEPGLDLLQCMEKVTSILNILKDRRTNDAHFRSIYVSAEKIANDLDIEAKIPRLVSRQKHRVNIPKEEPSDYFKVSVFNPFMDYLISEISRRFLEPENKTILRLQALIPAFLSAETEDEIEEAALFYENDLPDGIIALKGEISIWQEFWKNKPHKPSTAVEAFAEASPQFFPNIRQLLHILTVIPVTTATVERSFSTLRRVKTYLRNAIGEERLNGLVLLNVHRDIHLDPGQVIEKFALKNPRRLRLI